MSEAAPASEGPLSGYSVVELGVWIAAPAAAGVLADWGADVIKVEAPTGDPQRHFTKAIGIDLPNHRAPYFELDNRGKRGVALDLKDEADRAMLEQLVAEADVFVTNLRGQALAALDLDPATLRERYPRLVYARISGYGADGPDANRASYDMGAFYSRSGLADRMTLPGSPPPTIPPAFGDHITAMNLVAGISAALASRERTGEGRLVETSLMRTGTYTIGSDLALQLLNGRTLPAMPRTQSSAPLQNSYPTKDGRWLWLLCLESDRHWPKLVRALGEPEWASDARFSDARTRFANREALVEALDRTFSSRTLAEWREILDGHEVWFEPIQRLDDLVVDPQADSIRAFVEIPASSTKDALRSPASPVDFDGRSLAPVRASPEIGEHTDEIRKSLAKNESAS